MGEHGEKPRSSAKALPGHVRRFLLDMKVPGILATIGRSGGPVTSAVWYGLDGDELIVSTPAGKTKASNVGADERVSFIVDARERPYSGVAIEGRARIMEDPGGSGWRSIAVRYVGEPLPADIVDRFRANPRVLIRVTPLRVRTWNLAEDSAG